MKGSKIEWTDHTFNPWIGCTKVSPGCANCYAEARDQRFAGGAHWGKDAPRQRTSEANWLGPVGWNRNANICPICSEAYSEPVDCMCNGQMNPTRRARVFCASLADWLDDEVPLGWLADLLALIHATPNLDWLLLTKRPENWGHRVHYATAYLLAAKLAAGGAANAWCHGRAPENVWIGTTVEDQARADERIPQLLQIPARVRFLSCEPLLGPVDLRMRVKPSPKCRDCADCREVMVCENDDKWCLSVDWVICGGESGPHARPMHPAWARSLRDQCAASGVPFLFKQWGEWAQANLGNVDAAKEYRFIDFDGSDLTSLSIDQHTPATAHMVTIGKKAAGRRLDGVEHNGFPLIG